MTDEEIEATLGLHRLGRAIGLEYEHQSTGASRAAIGFREVLRLMSSTDWVNKNLHRALAEDLAFTKRRLLALESRVYAEDLKASEERGRQLLAELDRGMGER